MEENKENCVWLASNAQDIISEIALQEIYWLDVSENWHFSVKLKPLRLFP